MSILTEAEAIVNGPRQESYGHPFDNWSKTAELVNALLSHKLNQKLTAEDLILLMVQVKVARELNRSARDNQTDIAGYAALLEMVANERKLRAAQANVGDY